MNDQKQEDSRPSSAPHTFDEARTLFRQYSDYARQTITQRHKQDLRPGWMKALDLVGAAFVVAAAVTLITGFIKWPDAPIRQVASGFVGKTGLPHTREDYELFILWEKWLLKSFVLAFAVNIGIALFSKVGRRKGDAGS